jgi:ribokinase
MPKKDCLRIAAKREPMNPPQIVVIGSSNIDMVVAVPRIPAPGETVLGGQFVTVPGGKGANQAVAAARLGAKVTFVARLGRDAFAEASLANFAEAGIDPSFIVRDEEAASGVALIFVDPGGENAIAVAPGANARLAPADVDRAEAAIARADLVLLQLESPLETVAHAITVAKRHGKRVLLNPAPAQAVPPELLAQVDILTPNETEAEMLLGDAAAGLAGITPTAEALLERGVATVIVTLGKEGAFVVERGGTYHVPGRRVQAVDTTAAGDTFSGALATALAEGRELRPAIEWANAAAALSVTRRGAQSSIPTRAEVDAITTDV